MFSRQNFLTSLTSSKSMVDFMRGISRFKIKGWNAYNVITSLNQNKGGFMSQEQLESVVKTAYSCWYNYVIQLDSSLYGGRTATAIEEIKNDKALNPRNMSIKDCRDFVFGGFDKRFKGSGLRPVEAQDGNDPIEDGVLYQDFIHFYPFGIMGDISCRLYLNIKPEFRARLMSECLEQANEKGVKFYGKMWTGEGRSDNFLIYTNYRQMENVLNIIHEIKAKEPYLFEGADKNNLLLARVEDGVYFGEEPAYMHTSFNKERGDAIDEFYKDLMVGVYSKIGNYQGVIDTSSGETLDLKGYLNYRIEASFRDSLEKKQADIIKGRYPELPQESIPKYIRAENAVYRAMRGELPNYVKQQIDEKSDKIIEQLKQGKRPRIGGITIRTAGGDFAYFYNSDYEKRVLEKYGYFPYNEPIDFDIAEKLIDVFGMEEKIKAQITEESIKPYMDKHHVSIRRPFLNSETADDLIEEKGDS